MDYGGRNDGSRAEAGTEVEGNVRRGGLGMPQKSGKPKLCIERGGQKSADDFRHHQPKEKRVGIAKRSPSGSKDYEKTKIQRKARKT